MILYIDESGNTGETLSKDSKFNFIEQPYYVLAGILADENAKNNLETFVLSQIIKHQVQGDELKAKNLYESKPAFISELVDYIISNKIPFFIELMDKQFYMHIQLVEYFIMPYYSLPLNNQNIHRKRYIASTIGTYLNQDIYQHFVNTIKENTNEALESFYDILTAHFERINQNEIKINVEQTKIDYFEKKEIDEEQALEQFLPIPDENPNKRLIHLLPNFNAFTNLIARTQKCIDDFLEQKEFSIIHDEQKQFDVIFESALESMKTIDPDFFAQETIVAEKATFNIDDKLKLDFIDSKASISVQVSDLLAGFVMRFWNDFINGNEAKISRYLPLVKMLNYPIDNSSIGINYVVPDFYHLEIVTRMDL